jgi:hypothetical protein
MKGVRTSVEHFAAACANFSIGRVRVGIMGCLGRRREERTCDQWMCMIRPSALRWVLI